MAPVFKDTMHLRTHGIYRLNRVHLSRSQSLSQLVWVTMSSLSPDTLDGASFSLTQRHNSSFSDQAVAAFHTATVHLVPPPSLPGESTKRFREADDGGGHSGHRPNGRQLLRVRERARRPPAARRPDPRKDGGWFGWCGAPRGIGS